MPTKLILICIIHSVSKKDFLNYIIRKMISIIRRENNETMDVRIITFFSKSDLVLK